MTEALAKPAPRITADSVDFWKFTTEGKLMLRQCNACGNTMFYPRITCTKCLSLDLGWRQALGEGTVHAFTIVYRAPGEAFRPSVPYVVSIVELAEGPKIMSNILDCPVDQVAIGMPVQLVFEARGDDAAIPQFTPKSPGEK